MAKKGLGKGIDALFGDMPSAADELKNRVLDLELDLIDPNKEQPRKRFDQNELENLAESMRSVGVIQPITVAESNGRYMIIAGERRWRAAKLAGLQSIPALVRDLDKIRRLEIALIENLQREDLNPIEEALGIRHLMEECGLTQDAAAKRIGKSRPAVANLLRLLNLPEPVMDLVREEKISEGHARAIAGLGSPMQQIDLAHDVIQRGMNVRQCEDAVRRITQPQKGNSPQPDAESAESLRMLEDAARKAYGVRVAAQGSMERGALTIYYNSREELDRIYLSLQQQAGDV